MNERVDNFEQPIPDYRMPESESYNSELIVQLDGFEGPIDLLLALAREQKVDLTKISILGLAEQYLTFIDEAKKMKLEIAADYLVMAAWLAYLKSRLLLPEIESNDEPTGEQLAEALTYQLQRLESIRRVAVSLFERSLLGRDTFNRGNPEVLRVKTNSSYTATLYEILNAYGVTQRRHRPSPLKIEEIKLYSMDEALSRLSTMLGSLFEWSDLSSFLPSGLKDDLVRRSAIAATFSASLELVKSGKAEMRQEQSFGPIFFRGREEVKLSNLNES
ncbi:MAG: segregation/condensation protein A [Alphaproteobacteria bacterium]|jgi:segregation and condensation protein A|nr:segregation/condensation protein A [Alphaproteobacteria bacterium]PPR13346.1 MAG: Segregation and condensation protein A [Alphaproteobacteria bacterium MarineAlpha12_Bin1]|tara:strand:+ start:1300 stop:2124 length:825 start_codon:yes stop_codon:yes gene_type:complete